MTPEDFATEVITCWIPLVDVNEAMGSLQIHPNVAKQEQLLDTGGTPEKPRGGLIVPEALPPDPPLWMNMKAGEPHDHRWDLGCILLKMPAISLRQVMCCSSRPTRPTGRRPTRRSSCDGHS